MGLEILTMININRLHQLEKEVQDTHDKIRTQSWLVHHIIGRDAKSDCGDVLFDIDRIYEMVDEKTNITYVVIESHLHVVVLNEWHFSTVYIKKELFDMTGEELRANRERLSKELEAYNQEQLRLLEESKKEKELAAKKREYERLMAQVQKLESDLGK